MKRKMKRVLCLVCALLLTLSCSVTAFAAPPDVSTLTPTQTWQLGDNDGDVVANYYDSISSLIIKSKDDTKRYACTDEDKQIAMITWLKDNGKNLIKLYIDTNVTLVEEAFSTGYPVKAPEDLLQSVEFVSVGGLGIQIPAGCFYSQQSLQTVEGIWRTVVIGERAFKYCDSIVWPQGSLNLSDTGLTVVSTEAFNNAGNITVIRLPEDIALGDGCFMNNPTISNVYGMNKVTAMGRQVFDSGNEHIITIERDPVNSELPSFVLDYNWENDKVNVRYSKYKYTWNLVKATGVEKVYTYPEDNTTSAFPSTEVEITNQGIYSDSTLSTVYDMSTPATKDIELWAKMTTMYKVTFDTKGGSALGTIQLLPGSKITRPENPTKTDYTFNGWFKDAEYVTPWDFDNDVVNADTTLHAKWTFIGSTQYTVSFDTQGGSAIDAITVAANATITKPADPTKEGHAFGGWYKEAECTNAWDFTNDKVTANTTLYAKWTVTTGVTTYTVTFDTQGGSTVNAATVNAGALVTKPADPTKSGHTFSGWYKEAECTNAWNFATDTVNANVTLFAKWVTGEHVAPMIKHTVTLKLNGGKCAVETITVEDGALLPKPADPTKKGNTFAGWYKDEALSTAWNFETDTVTADITIYASWEPNEYTVKFKLNGGDGDADTQYVLHGGLVEEPDEPERDDYIFGGWYTSSDFTTKWNFDTNKVTKNMTLYAKWLSNEVTVAFNSQGGSEISPQVVTRGSFATAPTAPTRENFIFGGWYKEAECTNAFSFSTKITDDIVLYAKWTTTQVTVTFNSQGGSAVASAMVAPGSTVAVPVAPIRQGYTFLGWYKEVDCKTAWNFTTDVVNENTTLYAKWVAGVVKNPQTGDTTPLVPLGSIGGLAGVILAAFKKKHLF